MDTIRNVARCWTYETSVALEHEIPNELPYNDYFEYFGPDFKLHIQPSNMQNQNTQDYLDKIKTRLFENLRMLPHAPGVQMGPTPEDAINDDSDDDEDNPKNSDQRISIRASDKRVSNDGEYSDSEDEGEDGGRKDERNHKTPNKKSRTGASPVPDMVKDETEDTKPENGAAVETQPERLPSDDKPVAADSIASDVPCEQKHVEENWKGIFKRNLDASEKSESAAPTTTMEVDPSPAQRNEEDKPSSTDPVAEQLEAAPSTEETSTDATAHQEEKMQTEP